MKFKYWLISEEEAQNQIKCMLCGFLNPPSTKDSNSKECLGCGSNLKFKNIIQGPISFYHGPTTGSNNEKLNSFLKDGARPIGGGRGQGGGFFVSSSLEGTKEHAEGLYAGTVNPSKGVTHGGLPMVVTLEFPFIDTKLWDIDQEVHGRDMMDYLERLIEKSNKMNQLKGLPIKNTVKLNTNISPEDKSYLDKDIQNSVAPEKQLGRTTASKEMRDKDLMIKKFPKSMTFSDDKEQLMNIALGSEYEQSTVDGARNAVAYLSHQSRNPEFHHAAEAIYIKNKLKNKKQVSIKYLGNQNLPVKSIEVFKDGQWTNAGN